MASPICSGFHEGTDEGAAEASRGWMSGGMERAGQNAYQDSPRAGSDKTPEAIAKERNRIQQQTDEEWLAEYGHVEGEDDREGGRMKPTRDAEKINIQAELDDHKQAFFASGNQVQHIPIGETVDKHKFRIFTCRYCGKCRNADEMYRVHELNQPEQSA